MELWNTGEKVISKEVSFENMRFMKHKGESWRWSFEKYGDLWNTKKDVISLKTWRLMKHRGERYKQKDDDLLKRWRFMKQRGQCH